MSIPNSKLIAKNTLFLYFRMLLVTGVNLFAVRILLKTLGVEDYGIFNVVGGIVAMLSFFSSTMVSASQHFFSFELGRGDYVRLNQYFKLSAFVYLGYGVLVVILAETVGLWFLKTHLIIPENRMQAALWVYQFSIVSFLLQMLVIPYNAIIIAREEMRIYAYISVAEALLKLFIIYILLIVNSDKLVSYAVLMFLATLLISTLYCIYCIKKYKECKLSFFWDKKMFMEILSYSGWSLIGALSGLTKTYGVSILLNVFFNPVVIAAKAISLQVNNAMNLFVTNFYQAVRPQITKNYSTGNTQEMMSLVFRSSRFCYFLIMILAIPVFFEAPYILSLWLGEVPQYTVIFTRLTIVVSLVEAISYPLMAAIMATGRIRLYQIITGGFLLLNLPLSYYFLVLGYSPEFTIYVGLGIALLAQISRLAFMKRLHNISITAYLSGVVLVIATITIASSVAPYIITQIMEEGIVRFIILSAATTGSCIFIIYSIGMNPMEKIFFKNLLISRFQSITFR